MSSRCMPSSNIDGANRHASLPDGKTASRLFAGAMKPFGWLALVGGLLVAGTALAGGDIEERRPLARDGIVVVKNVKGEVIARGWDRDEVQITGELGDGTRGLEIEGSERQLRIEVKNPSRHREVEETTLEIRLPSSASLVVETTSADIEVEDLSGEFVELTTVSGDVEVGGGGVRVLARTVSGDIDLDTVAQRIELNTVSGDVNARTGGEVAELTTVSGELVLRAEALLRGHFESVSGDMEIDIGLKENASITVASLSGDIDLIVPESMSATCEVESFSGSIKSTRGRVVSAKYGPNKSLRFVSGDGSGRIQVESFSGDVRVRS